MIGMSIKEQKMWKCLLIRQFGSKAYSLAVKEEYERAEREGRDPECSGVIAKRFLEKNAGNIPGKVPVLKTCSIVACNAEKAVQTVTEELNAVRRLHPEMKIVSPIQVVNNFLDMTATVTYQIEVYPHQVGRV